MDEIIEETSKGHRFASVGAALAVLCFFLPWILVSCGGQRFSFSWQLAAGTSMGAGYFAQEMPGKPVLFVVLVAGLLALGVAYAAYKRRRLTEMDGYGLMALGAVPLLVLLTQFSGSKNQAAQQGMYTEYQFGLAGVVIGHLAVIAGGAFNQRELSMEANQPEEGT